MGACVLCLCSLSRSYTACVPVTGARHLAVRSAAAFSDNERSCMSVWSAMGTWLLVGMSTKTAHRYLPATVRYHDSLLDTMHTFTHIRVSDTTHTNSDSMASRNMCLLPVKDTLAPYGVVRGIVVCVSTGARGTVRAVVAWAHARQAAETSRSTPSCHDGSANSHRGGTSAAGRSDYD